MEDDDEVAAMERKLARQSRRTRFVGGVAASLMSLLAIGAALLALTQCRMLAAFGDAAWFDLRSKAEAPALRGPVFPRAGLRWRAYPSYRSAPERYLNIARVPV